MAKYNIPALTTWAVKSAEGFWNHAKKAFNKKGFDIGTMPTIVMNARLTATAGRAFSAENMIDLSCYLMTRNYEHFHKDTIPHELCHIIADKLGSKGHDAIWRNVCVYLGVKPERCHSMTTKYEDDMARKTK